MGLVHIQAELIEHLGGQVHGVRAVAAAHSLAVSNFVNLFIYFRAVITLVARLVSRVAWLQEVVSGVGPEPVPVIWCLLGGRWDDGPQAKPHGG